MQWLAWVSTDSYFSEINKHTVLPQKVKQVCKLIGR